MNEFEFPVEAGHVMLFARTFDEDRRWTAGEAAPPTFPAAAAQYNPDYPLRPRPGRPWIDVASLSGEQPFLHAEQHFEYHSPMRVGDVFTVSTRPGDTWTKTNRRGQTLSFVETVSEYRNADGDLVVTARSVAVRTEAAQ
jgi:hypothetical protein